MPMEKTFNAAEAESAHLYAVGRGGRLQGRAPMPPRRRKLLHHDPAAQRDGLAACGSRLQQHAAGHPDRAGTGCAALTRSGSRARIMPGSPRR